MSSGRRTLKIKLSLKSKKSSACPFGDFLLIKHIQKFFMLSDDFSTKGVGHEFLKKFGLPLAAAITILYLRLAELAIWGKGRLVYPPREEATPAMAMTHEEIIDKCPWFATKEETEKHLNILIEDGKLAQDEDGTYYLPDFQADFPLPEAMSSEISSPGSKMTNPSSSAHEDVPPKQHQAGDDISSPTVPEDVLWSAFRPVVEGCRMYLDKDILELAVFHSSDFQAIL